MPKAKRKPSWKRESLGNGYFRRDGSAVIWKQFTFGRRNVARSLGVATLAEAKRAAAELEPRLRAEYGGGAQTAIAAKLPPALLWPTVEARLTSVSVGTKGPLGHRIRQFAQYAERQKVKDLLRLNASQARQVVSAFLSERSKAVGALSVRHEQRALSRAFSTLRRSGVWVGENPAAGDLHELPAVPPPTKRRLALEEDELLFQHRRDDLFIWPSVILGRLGGLRPAESRALTWEDVRFDERFIRIRGLGGKKSGRIIPLGQTLADELRDLHKAQTARKILGAFVSANAEGRATAKSVQIHRFEKLRRKIGLADDVTLYSLRRSHEQTLIDGGVRLEEAAQMMGHSPAVALKHYAQLNVIGRADFAEVAAGTWSNKGGKAACALPNALPRNP